MTESVRLPGVVVAAVEHLRRRGIPLGINDCDDLWRSLAAGFGWESDEQFVEVCVALWATSAEEAGTIRAVFALVGLPKWRTTPQEETPSSLGAQGGEAGEAMDGNGLEAQPSTGPPPTEAAPAQATLRPMPTVGHSVLPPIPTIAGADPSLLFLSQFPVADRQIAQVWRGLRHPSRHGPATELDAIATLDRYARQAVATPPLLVAARRNTARLLVLSDRQGSMTPFHRFVDRLLAVIGRAARLERLDIAYFHNTAGGCGEYKLLDLLEDPFHAELDPIVRLVAPLRNGGVYEDPELSTPRPLSWLRDLIMHTTMVAVISDAGAGRGHLNLTRVLDTIALLRWLMAEGTAVVWLNPLDTNRWAGSTSARIARHVPMFPLTAGGMHGAVEVLRGRPRAVEHPL